MGVLVSRLGRRKVVVKTPVIAEPEEEDDLSSDTTSSWDEVDEAAYDAAWDVLDEVFEAACLQLERQGWKRTAIDSRRLELEDAEAALSKEEQEAIEAEFAAAKEKEEYEAALREMEREKAEMEEAEAAARKEQEEAEEAEVRLGEWEGTRYVNTGIIHFVHSLMPPVRSIGSLHMILVSLHLDYSTTRSRAMNTGKIIAYTATGSKRAR
jgi:hypothetical protein